MAYSSKHNPDADYESVEARTSSSTDAPIEVDEVVKLKAQIRRLKRYISELEQTADTDPLVDIYNRRAFIRELSRAQSVLGRYEIPSSIVYFDLINFQDINDKFGHAMGDDMLKRVAQALKSGVRSCDMVARLGGDQFGVLLFKTELHAAEEKATELANLVADIQIEFPTQIIGINTSWGVSVCDRLKTADQILSDADEGMFASKRG